MQETLVDLPREIQYEIFQYLPVDHLDAVYNLRSSIDGNYGSMIPSCQGEGCEPNIHRDVLIGQYGLRKQWDLLRLSGQIIPSAGAWRDSLLFMDSRQDAPDLESEVSYNKLLLEAARGGATGLVALLLQDNSVPDEIISLAFFIALGGSVQRNKPNPSKRTKTQQFELEDRLEVDSSNIRTASWILENIDKDDKLVFPNDLNEFKIIQVGHEYHDYVRAIVDRYSLISTSFPPYFHRYLVPEGAVRNYHELRVQDPILLIREYIYLLIKQDQRDQQSGVYNLSILESPPYSDLVNLLHLIAEKGNNPFTLSFPRLFYLERGWLPVAGEDLGDWYLDKGMVGWHFKAGLGASTTNYVIYNRRKYPMLLRDMGSSKNQIETQYPLMTYLGYHVPRTT